MASRLIEKTVGSVRLQGFSLAGEETVVIAPEMNVAFDVGRAPREVISIDHVCLTHGHMDHAAGLAYYASQRGFLGAPPGTVIAHRRLIGPIERLLQVWGEIEGHVSEARLIGVDEDEDVSLRRDLVVRPFRVRHGGPSLGYSMVEVRKKLKPEYASYSGQQIAEAKRRGETVEYRLEMPRLAFCGDTAPGPFLDYAHVSKAEVLIVECTFFEDDHMERARLGRHTHVTDLPELYERVESPHVVLTHISRRTFLRDARRILAKILKPADIERTVILMERPPRRREGS